MRFLLYKHYRDHYCFSVSHPHYMLLISSKVLNSPKAGELYEEKLITSNEHLGFPRQFLWDMYC